MKKFIAILKNKKKGELSRELLNLHIVHLKKLNKQGKLYLCGPFENNDGAMQILLANSKREAEALLQSDPFIKSNYYQEYDLFSLIEANEDNNYLLEDSQTKGNLSIQ